ncbi:hypothetical protein HK405_006754 [Cladochytrium tenue]|nr:hypothetical protein HK405_006754 [Cladochytrium tenue]
MSSTTLSARPSISFRKNFFLPHLPGAGSGAPSRVLDGDAKQHPRPPSFAFAVYELEATLTFTCASVPGLAVLQTGRSTVPATVSYPRNWQSMDRVVTHTGVASNDDSQQNGQQPADRDSTSTVATSVVAPGQQPELPFHMTLTSTTSRSFRLVRAETCLVMRLRHRHAPPASASELNSSSTSALVTAFVRVNPGATSSFELSANGPPRSAHAVALRARIDVALSPDVLPPAVQQSLGWGLDWGLEHAVEVAVTYKETVGIVLQKAVFRFPVRVVEGCMAACAKDTVRWYSSLPIPPGWPGHSEVAVEEYKKQVGERL